MEIGCKGHSQQAGNGTKTIDRINLYNYYWIETGCEGDQQEMELLTIRWSFFFQTTPSVIDNYCQEQQPVTS